MKHSCLSFFTVILLLGSSASAAVVITSTVSTTTGVRVYNATLGLQNDPDHTLTDTFAYDPLDPTSASPDTGFTNTTHYHAANPLDADGNSVLDYAMTHTFTAADPIFVVDLWGRSGSGRWTGRDDTIDITVFDALGVAVSTTVNNWHS